MFWFEDPDQNLRRLPEVRLDGFVRYRARIELGARDTDKVMGALKKWMAKLDKKDPNYEHNLLEALWLHQSHNVVNRGLLAQVLASPDFRT